MMGLLLFALALLLLFFGFPVAFTFAGAAVLMSFFIERGFEQFYMMPDRLYGIMGNETLMAIPMFIYMGVVLQKTGLAERLLESMGKLFGPLPGGLAISTIIVGAFLAASTGVVGASVVAMGVISLPVMLKYGYDQKLATGVICASGTLGQIIPPSIILIILADQLGVPTGQLFQAAIVPGLVLVGCYSMYVLAYATVYRASAPPIPNDNQAFAALALRALGHIVPPLLLIIIVLGSILKGIATPTESSAIGALGALLLSALYGSFKKQLAIDSAIETIKITSMVFAVLIGATAFSLMFDQGQGNVLIEEFIVGQNNGVWTFIILAMVLIFVLGFFIDFVEIAFIIVPILYPIASSLGIHMEWFAVLIAMNLQSSFMTPPFGFSLFYLKGVAPATVPTTAIYKGVIPFIVLQLLVVALLILFPQWFGFEEVIPWRPDD